MKARGQLRSHTCYNLRRIQWRTLQPVSFVLAKVKIHRLKPVLPQTWLLFSSNNSGAARRRPTRRRSSGNCVERGYAASADANSADVVVVNTCTVTAAADLQARQAIHDDSP